MIMIVKSLWRKLKFLFCFVANRVYVEEPTFFSNNRINQNLDRLYKESNSQANDEEAVAKNNKTEPPTITIKRIKPMSFNIDIEESDNCPTPLESAIESALMFGENMYFSVMATNTAKNLVDPNSMPVNLTPDAYAAYCEYTAQLFATAAAARQELHDISA